MKLYKIGLSVLLTTIGSYSIGQATNTITASDSVVLFNQIPCPFTIPEAQKDIDSNRLCIVFRGGFQGFPKENAQKSSRFQEKYHVHFVYIGCMPWYDMTNEDITGYNRTIFEHLNNRYGGICRKEFDQIFL